MTPKIRSPTGGDAMAFYDGKTEASAYPTGDISYLDGYIAATQSAIELYSGLKMPRNVFSVWLITVLLLIGYPVLSFLYFTSLGESGALPFDGDSIAIPIFGNTLITLIVAPLLIVIVRACLIDYRSDIGILAWRTDKPIRSAVLSVLFGGGALFAFLSAIFMVLEDSSRYDYIWSFYFMLWAALLMMLRASIVSR